jgi:hypothetical protein
MSSYGKYFIVVSVLYVLVVQLHEAEGASCAPYDAPTVRRATRTIHFVNRCDQPIWVGAQGHPLPNYGGWTLNMGQSFPLSVPDTFTAGRFWPRTGCRLQDNGRFVCQTGDCDGRFQCGGIGGLKPSTLVELTLAPNIDYYDLSNVDGHSIGVSVEPVSGQCQMINNPHLGRFNCGSPKCSMNTRQCPPELRIYDGNNHTYCMSICAAVMSESQRRQHPMLQRIYDNPDQRMLVCCECGCGPECGCTSPASKYCCSPHNNSPIEVGGKCYVESWPQPSPGSWPNRYDQVFKSQCPDAYSWQFDDFESTFQCKNADYIITFCP